jgi:hypothetical protein
MILRNRTKSEIELIVLAAIEMWYLTSLVHTSNLEELDVQYLVKESENEFEIKLSWITEAVKAPLSLYPAYKDEDDVIRDGKSFFVPKHDKIRKVIKEINNILEDLV